MGTILSEEIETIRKDFSKSKPPSSIVDILNRRVKGYTLEKCAAIVAAVTRLDFKLVDSYEEESDGKSKILKKSLREMTFIVLLKELRKNTQMNSH